MTWLLKKFVILYRLTLGPWLGGQCRFQPTCSQFALDALDKYGPVRGTIKTIGRIARCHPFGGEGFDPP